MPYFLDLGVDKNFTITNRFYATEYPLFLGEYHQAFGTLICLPILDTPRLQENKPEKRAGEKSHLFSRFTRNFKNENNFDNSLELNLQEVSNDKYLKLYKIDSNLVNYDTETLENSFKFTQERENLFFSLNMSVYETLKNNYEDKYEYILPELTLDKNLFYDEKRSLNLQTTIKLIIMIPIS